jgi:hypothetical protein
MKQGNSVPMNADAIGSDASFRRLVSNGHKEVGATNVAPTSLYLTGSGVPPAGASPRRE